MPAAAPAVLSLRERRRAETRAEIVRCALARFASEGFDNVSVEQICTQAAVSRATFFNYFAQKEEVLVEIGRMRLAKVEQCLGQWQSGAAPPSFAALLDLFAGLARDNEETARMGKHILPRVLASPGIAAEWRGLQQTLRARLAACFAGLQRAGHARSSLDPALAAGNIAAVYFWTTVEWSMDPAAKPGALPRILTRRLAQIFDSFAVPKPVRGRVAARGHRL